MFEASIKPALSPILGFYNHIISWLNTENSIILIIPCPKIMLSCWDEFAKLELVSTDTSDFYKSITKSTLITFYLWSWHQWT
jgi:hypothetical protein